VTQPIQVGCLLIIMYSRIRDPPWTVGQVEPDVAIPRWRAHQIVGSSVGPAVDADYGVAGVAAHFCGQGIELRTDRGSVGQ
jgi:hypothetical protein